MTTVRYARVNATITDENSDDNANQLETIDSEEEDEENVLPETPVKKFFGAQHDDPNVTIKHSAERRSLIRTVLWTGLLILCYFILSIGLTFYQRWLLKV
jgi:solute carrier family 35, member C2